MRVKRAFVILLVVTIVWMSFWSQHIVAYKQMVREWEEERFKKTKEEYENEKSGLPKPLHSGMMKEEECGCVDKLGLLKPFWGYGNGPFLILSGFMVCMAWGSAIIGLSRICKKAKQR